MRSRRLALLASALLAVAAAGASPAVATTGEPDGLWYYTAAGLDRAHQTTTGEGVTVAVLDSAVNPEAPDLVGTDLVTHPEAYCTFADGSAPPGVSTAEDATHGTNVVALIIGTGAGVDGQPGIRGVAPDATVLHYSVGSDTAEECGRSGGADAIEAAVDDGADIINLSWGGEPAPGEVEAIARAQREGVIIVVGAPNEATSDLGWPADANGVLTVQSADENLQLNPVPVTGPRLGAVAPGEGVRHIDWSGGAWNTYSLANGSSYAAPFTSGVLALVWSQHPDATANQVIQAVLRNTSGHDGELARDDTWGYGAVSALGALAVDPTTYPDENPLLVDEPFMLPAYEDVVGGAAPTPTPQESTGSTADPDAGGSVDGPEDADGSPLGLGLVLGGVALLVLLVVVAVIVLTTRRRGGTQTDPRPMP